MSRPYASRTSVPVDRSRAEIEQTLAKYKARATAVFQSEEGAAVAFEMHERRVMFRITLPKPGSVASAASPNVVSCSLP